MTKSEIISMLGNKYTEGNRDPYAMLYEIDYSDLGISIDLNNETDIAERIHLYNEKTGTRRGIEVGSTIEDVISAYNKENEQIYYIKNGKFYDGIYNGTEKDIIQYVEVGITGFIRYEGTKETKICFYIENGKVSSITFGHGAE